MRWAVATAAYFLRSDGVPPAKPSMTTRGPLGGAAAAGSSIACPRPWAKRSSKPAATSPAMLPAGRAVASRWRGPQTRGRAASLAHTAHSSVRRSVRSSRLSRGCAARRQVSRERTTVSSSGASVPSRGGSSPSVREQTAAAKRSSGLNKEAVAVSTSSSTNIFVAFLGLCGGSAVSPGSPGFTGYNAARAAPRFQRRNASTSHAKPAPELPKPRGFAGTGGAQVHTRRPMGASCVVAASPSD
jgi:hypothetical protein